MPATDSAIKKYIHSVLGPPADLSRKPIKFQEVSNMDFMTFITSLKKRNSEDELGISALSTHRAAFLSLYKDFHEAVNPTVYAEIKLCYQGLLKEKATKRQSGLALC